MKKCKKCNSFLDDSNFWSAHQQLDICKDCCLRNVNVYDDRTFIWILKLLNIPYMRQEWVRVRREASKKKKTGANKEIKKLVLSKYIATMRLASYKNFTFRDTAFLNQSYFKDNLGKEVKRNG